MHSMTSAAANYAVLAAFGATADIVALKVCLTCFPTCMVGCIAQPHVCCRTQFVLQGLCESH